MLAQTPLDLGRVPYRYNIDDIVVALDGEVNGVQVRLDQFELTFQDRSKPPSSIRSKRRPGMADFFGSEA
jgi:hypothetical protein